MQKITLLVEKLKVLIWSNKRNRYIFLVLLLIFILVFARIYMNISANKQRAARMSRQQTIVVQYGKVERGSIVPIVKFSGSLEPVWSADISSKVAGRIEKVFVSEGDYVQAGQILAVLDSSEYKAQMEQARGSVYESAAGLEQNKLDYERAQKLYVQGAVSQQFLESAKFKMNMAQGKLESATGSYDSLNNRYESTVIRAPRAGVIARKLLQDGAYAAVSSPIVTIADTTKLLAKVSVGEAEIGSIVLGQIAKLSVQAYSKEFTGVVTRIYPVASMPARNFTVEVTVDNASNELRGGMFANSFINVKPHQNVLIIPQSAIVMREDQKTVYLVNKDSVLEQKLINTGYIGEGKVEVLSGIDEGATIVVGGQNRVREGIKVQPNETGGK